MMQEDIFKQQVQFFLDCARASNVGVVVFSRDLHVLLIMISVGKRAASAIFHAEKANIGERETRYSKGRF